MMKNIIKIIFGIICGTILMFIILSTLEIVSNGFVSLDFGFMSIFSGTCEKFGRDCFEVDIASNMGTLEFLLTGR